MVSLRGTVLAGCLLSLGLLACPPNLNQTVSIVTSTRILGVRAVPAEVAPMPGTPQTFTALVAGPGGDEADAAIDWALCVARKPLAQLGPVNPVCLERAVGSNFVPLGSGTQVTGMVPDDSCRLFGPVVPPQMMMNQPPGRPVDPDPTGGYYQPLQVVADSKDGRSLAVFRTRLYCGLAQGNGPQMASYGNRYHTNVNPEVQALTPTGGSAFLPRSTGMKNVVKAGQRLDLEVSWAACPLVDRCGDGVCGADESTDSCAGDCSKPQGCTGAERYVNLDLVSSAIVDLRERITVSWFATGGSFDSDSTGRDSSDTATTSPNGWTAPSEPSGAAPLTMWVVLQDDRGGAGWAEYLLDVR